MSEVQRAIALGEEDSWAHVVLGMSGGGSAAIPRRRACSSERLH
jgi:hypothetical protein